MGIYSPPKLDHLRRHDVRLGSSATEGIDVPAFLNVRFAPKADKWQTFRFVRLVPIAT
jgi:hypothetical protein